MAELEILNSEASQSGSLGSLSSPRDEELGSDEVAGDQDLLRHEE